MPVALAGTDDWFALLRANRRAVADVFSRFRYSPKLFPITALRRYPFLSRLRRANRDVIAYNESVRL
jgi:hypothetical protein